MKKFAFIFPGQGSQTIKMLSELGKIYPEILTSFEEASDALGYNLWNLIQEGPVEDLNKTDITQPAILTASVALGRIIVKNSTLLPNAIAGHSLGEFSALTYAKSISLPFAVKLVAQRGKIMQHAIPIGEGTMAAILGLSSSTIDEICRSISMPNFIVEIANFNSKEQTVISGNTKAVQEAMLVCKNHGAKRTIELSVSIPSHCSLLFQASNEFHKVLDTLQIALPKEKLLQNVSADEALDILTLRENLVQQMYKPVKWVDIMQTIISFGIDTFIEVGPGKVLAGLLKKVQGVSCYSTSTPQTLQETLEYINK